MLNMYLYALSDGKIDYVLAAFNIEPDALKNLQSFTAGECCQTYDKFSRSLGKLRILWKNFSRESFRKSFRKSSASKTMQTVHTTSTRIFKDMYIIQ